MSSETESAAGLLAAGARRDHGAIDVDIEATPPEGARPAHSAVTARVRRAMPSWITSPNAWTWIGMACVVAGFVLFAVGWGGVAGETQVYRQLPYIASAGFTGLGLVVLGVAAVNMATRQNDLAVRRRQLAELTEVLNELRRLEDGDQGVGPS